MPPGATFRDLAVDADGKLYAVDATGDMVWACGKAETSFKPLTKSLKDVMSFPAYITVTKGRIYVVDENGGGIVILGQDGVLPGPAGSASAGRKGSCATRRSSASATRGRDPGRSAEQSGPGVLDEVTL